MYTCIYVSRILEIGAISKLRCAFWKLIIDMVTFALKTWKNKVKMYKVIGIQYPTLHPNLIRANVITSN